MVDENAPQEVMRKDPQLNAEIPGAAAGKTLTPAARRALLEAEQRRRAAAQSGENLPKEIGGRKGAEPVRYGDWEKGGRAVDF